MVATQCHVLWWGGHVVGVGDCTIFPAYVEELADSLERLFLGFRGHEIHRATRAFIYNGIVVPLWTSP